MPVARLLALVLLLGVAVFEDITIGRSRNALRHGLLLPASRSSHRAEAPYFGTHFDAE